MRGTRLFTAVLVTALLTVATLAACSGGNGNLPDPASEGAQLFTANCARCHGGDAGGMSSSGPSLRGGMPADEVEDKIRNGVDNKMPKFEDSLSDADIDTLVEYVSTLPPED